MRVYWPQKHVTVADGTVLLVGVDGAWGVVSRPLGSWLPFDALGCAARMAAEEYKNDRDKQEHMLANWDDAAAAAEVLNGVLYVMDYRTGSFKAQYGFDDETCIGHHTEPDYTWFAVMEPDYNAPPHVAAKLYEQHDYHHSMRQADWEMGG